MSKIIRHADTGRELSHIVKTDNGSFYYVDSNDTFDLGYETMAFIYDEEKDEVGSWAEVYVKHYTAANEMIEGHRYACEHLEELLCDKPKNMEDEQTDYIKREDAKNMMRKFKGYYDEDAIARFEIALGAGYIPPNEDVVEVVRCKDCRFKYPRGFCKSGLGLLGYCSKGESVEA